ncbi:MAG: putative Xenobiotic-transporting ATPase [Edaphobacter sp.]|nr:putative Xenobiotic-transporting ATPase [Edaphobacter sp.]
MAGGSSADTRDGTELKRSYLWPLLPGRRAPPAIYLLSIRQRIVFAVLVLERVIVGCCDLLLAGTMYLLFMLLQGIVPAHHRWWTTTSTLSAAMTTAALVVARAVLDLASTRSAVAHIQNLCTDLLLRLTQGYNELQWARFAQRNRSDLLNHAMSTVHEASNFYHLSIEIAASAVVVALMTCALIYQSPPAACGLGATIATFYGLHRFLIRVKLQRAAAEHDESLRALQRTLADMFASAREIRSYGIGAFLQERIRGQARSVRVSFRRVVFLPQVARILADQGVVLVFLGVVIVVQLRHGDSRQLLSLLVFYFVLCRRLLPLISQLSFLAGQMERSYKSVLTVCDELEDCSVNRTAEATIQEARGDLILELDQVSFSFRNGVRILDNVSLSIRQGETVVLCGVSGSGKSSLLNVIAGLLQPASGVVMVERGRVAYVPQEVVLLDDSIRNNLLFGMPGVTDQELMRALAVANLAEFLVAHPLGLDTGVGDNGVLLSGGQRQRIGLARAILRGASLLLLDEATSALDEANEARILENLRASGVAVLLVTHRIYREARDLRILRLERGCLVDDASGKMRTANVEGQTASPAW